MLVQVMFVELHLVISFTTRQPDGRFLQGLKNPWYSARNYGCRSCNVGPCPSKAVTPKASSVPVFILPLLDVDSDT